jgi:hypothetical protein
VAITAVNANRRHVMLVAEGRRLRPRNPSVGHIRRPLKLNASPQHAGKRKNPGVDRSSGYYVRTAMKNLHLLELSLELGLEISHTFASTRTNHPRINKYLVCETGNYNSSTEFGNHLSASGQENSPDAKTYLRFITRSRGSVMSSIA